MRLLLKKMEELETKDVSQCDEISKIFKRLLELEKYKIVVSNPTSLRIVGIQDGELILALPCKIYKKI